ncbi:MAG: hypothetical protein C4331_04560 [Meiothermus sp.]
MGDTGRGLLGLLSPTLLGQLLRELPRGETLAENVQGGLLTPEFVQRLRGEGFSGYALAQLKANLAWLAFYKGRLLEAWRQTDQGSSHGVAAYQATQGELAGGTLSLYRLSPEAIPPILALTGGILRAAALPAGSVVAADLFASLGQEGFTGALVLEDGSSGQGWYFSRGQVLFGAEIPGGFGAGRLHMAHTSAEAPPDLFTVLEQQEQQRQQERLEALWGAAQAVLREYMGRGAVPALERLRRTHTAQDPGTLGPSLRRWLETSLEPNAALMFDRLVKG